MPVNDVPGDDEAITGLSGLPMSDLSIGAVVLVGDYNWRKGPFWLSLCALVMGRRQRFTHLSMECTVAWWRGQPYLFRMREART